MPELPQQQHCPGSQLGVAQVQAAQAAALPNVRGQGLAAAARQVAAPQPAGPRRDSSGEDVAAVLELLGLHRSTARAACPYRSTRSWQARCRSPSHSSCTPSSRSPVLKDRSSSSRCGLVPSTAARSWQQALVRRVYRNLRERASSVLVLPCHTPLRCPPPALCQWDRGTRPACRILLGTSPALCSPSLGCVHRDLPGTQRSQCRSP